MCSDSNPRVRFVLVDDHPLIRDALRQRITRERRWSVVGEASSQSEALLLIREKEPDFVIVETCLRRGSGLELIKNVASAEPSLKCLVLSGGDEFLYAERAIRAGARGYVSKSEPGETVLSAIQQILDGRVWLSEAVTTAILTRAGGRHPGVGAGPIEVLSDRELEVYEHLGRGMSVKEIAGSLHLSPKTIEYHREHIKEKLQLPSSNAVLRHATAWVLGSRSDGR